MRVVGAHVVIDNERYLVGFVVVSDGQVEQAFSFGAPRDEAESAQFQELYARALTLLREKRPDEFALRVSEIPSSPSRSAIAHRAEGALLAAAGHIRGLVVSKWLRSQLAKPAKSKGAEGAKADQITAALCDLLDPTPSSREQKQAAVAAAAALVSAKVL